jgi:two-component system, response regulator RegA
MNTTSLNIQILEDDEALATALTNAFKKRGHYCFWQKSITEFQQFLQAQEQPIDLILMDLKLESQSSLAYIQDARSHYPEAKIFMVTGYASIATTVEAIKQGADNYLPKPLNADDILSIYFGGADASNINTEVKDDRLSPKRLEWEHIQRVLQENAGNISKTAEALSMHRRTLQRKLQKKPHQ